jgi:hypothetical protein
MLKKVFIISAFILIRLCHADDKPVFSFSIFSVNSAKFNTLYDNIQIRFDHG